MKSICTLNEGYQKGVQDGQKQALDQIAKFETEITALQEENAELKTALEEEREHHNVYVQFTADKVIGLKKALELVEVVRCGECKSWTGIADGVRSDGWCKCLEEYHDSERPCTEKDHFCSYGEERMMLKNEKP
jgi:hypothetical protein